MTEKLTRGQLGLIALLNAGFDRRYISEEEAAEKELARAFDAAKDEGLIRSAGWECSAKGDDWLDSPAGRLALTGGKE